MKQTILTVSVFLALATSAFAQPLKGDWLTGVNVVPFNFKVGKFFSNRVTVTLNFQPSISYRPSEKVTDFSLWMLPSARYYFVSKEGLMPRKLCFFGDLAIGSSFNFYANKNDVTVNYAKKLRAGIAPGLLYMVNDGISIDAAWRFNYYANSLERSDDDWFGTNAEVGIQIYLKGKKNRSQEG